MLVVHRGRGEPPDLPPVAHLHVDRLTKASARDQLAAFRADAVVDISHRNGEDASSALAALPAGVRIVAISRSDVYRAFEAVRADRQTDAVP